jgi:hypothetical protein
LDRAFEENMEGPSIFISSVSRRQLQRRRMARTAFRLQPVLSTLLIVGALMAFAVVRFGI